MIPPSSLQRNHPQDGPRNTNTTHLTLSGRRICPFSYFAGHWDPASAPPPPRRMHDVDHPPLHLGLLRRHYEVLVVAVLGPEPHEVATLAALAEYALHGDLLAAPQQHDDDLAVGRVLVLLHDEHVPVLDTCPRHALTDGPEGVTPPARTREAQLRRQVEGLVVHRHGLQAPPGGYAAQQRHLGGRLPAKLREPDAPRPPRRPLPLDVASLL